MSLTDAASPLAGALRPSDVPGKEDGEAPVLEETDADEIVVIRSKQRSASVTEMSMVERQAYYLEKKASKQEALKAEALKKEEALTQAPARKTSNYKMAAPRKSLVEQSAERADILKAAAAAAEKMDKAPAAKKKVPRKSKNAEGLAVGRRNTWDGAIGAVVAANKIKKKVKKLPKLGAGAPKSSAERKNGGKLDEELKKLKNMKKAAEDKANEHDTAIEEKAAAEQLAKDQEAAAVKIQVMARNHAVMKQYQMIRQVQAAVEAEKQRVAAELASRVYKLQGNAARLHLFAVKDTDTSFSSVNISGGGYKGKTGVLITKGVEVTAFEPNEKYEITLDTNGKIAMVKGSLLDTNEIMAAKAAAALAKAAEDKEAAEKAALQLERDNETDEQKLEREIEERNALRARADAKRKASMGDQRMDISDWKNQGKIKARETR
jgi:hypothetical protein